MYNPRVSKRKSWVTSSPLSDAYGRAQDALQSGQPFDLVIIDILDITEIEQGFNLARDMKNRLSAKPFIALALPELTLEIRTTLRQAHGVDYFTDQLGDPQTLRVLLLHEEEWRQPQQPQA